MTPPLSPAAVATRDQIDTAAAESARRALHIANADVPVLQFAYHFRNACGHGDLWNYSPSGPPHPAACRGLVLTGALVGRRATWETVTPRLFVEFLDDITEHFAPGMVPPPARAA